MKLLPRPPKDVRVNTQDSLGHGMDAVIMIVIFLGAGFGLDRLFGTVPVFMIVMTVIGAIGLFARFYYQYSAKMDQHADERVASRTKSEAR
jgi:ATP synthase protein I